jgi:2,3-bisphosphoglycerate-dependent phosphoglycerate mutase
MQIYFIRHGQSTNNILSYEDGSYDYERVSDPSLTDIGVEQAKYVGKFLAQKLEWPADVTIDTQNRYGFGLTHLYCSLMIRAVHTGSIISSHVGLPLVGLPQVHEVGGVYTEELVNGESQISLEHGGTPAFYKEHFPLLRFEDPIEERGWWQGGREDVEGPLKRAQDVIAFLKERHFETDDRVAIVTHGAFYNHMLRAIFGIALDEPDGRRVPLWYSFCNCAVSRFDFSARRVFISYLNRTDFFPDELVTY